MASVAEIFGAMADRFNPDAAAGMDAVFQYDVTGDDGGKWYCAIKDGACDVQEGEHESPSITITIADSDFVDMIEGRLNGQQAFMSGKLKIGGDMMLAMKIGTIFTMGES